MKYLVTGGCGFIGSAFVNDAVRNRNNVLNIDGMKYSAKLSNIEVSAESKYYSFKELDLLDYEELETCFNNFKPDVVVHFAAESHVDNSINNPRPFIESNIVGTFNLLEVSRKYYERLSSEKDFLLLHVSTDEVFGDLEIGDPKFNECSLYQPSSPYSASKAASDHLVRAWHRTYKLPVIISNCSNNYGPRQDKEKFIPKIILNALNEKEIPIYGSGNNIRDWLFVKDHIDALNAIIRSGKIGDSYVIGGNCEMTNIFVAELICGLLDTLLPRNNPYSDLIKFTEDRAGHDKRYAIDASKIFSHTGWKPFKEFNQGIAETISWYLKHF